MKTFEFHLLPDDSQFCQTTTYLNMAGLHSNKAVHFPHSNHSADRTVDISQQTAGSRSPTHQISISLTYPLRSLYECGSVHFDGQQWEPEIIYNNASQNTSASV
jgi:hypothetical protein